MKYIFDMSHPREFCPTSRYLSLNPYELHKHLINTYVLNKIGATKLLRRDCSRDKRDIDVIRENHRFLWEEDQVPTTWEERLAKKYYDKLFKEYCISDLSRYKENQFAMRWQTEQEMVMGKGQFTCGAKNCLAKNDLKTWEVNFAYIEQGEKKNALVKLRLCPNCSKKLNYKFKRKEVKRIIKPQVKDVEGASGESASGAKRDKPVEEAGDDKEEDKDGDKDEEAKIWSAPAEASDDISREDEFQQYLQHLFL